MAESGESQPITEIWDPTLKKNVAMQGGLTPETYIAQNWNSYKDYGGPITHKGAAPITTRAYGYTPTTSAPRNKPGPTGFNPEAYEASQEQIALGQGAGAGGVFDPAASQYNPYLQGQYELEKQFGQAMRMIPGTRPDVGVMAGSNEFWDLLQGKRIDPSAYGKYQIDPLTMAYGQVASRGPVTPSFWEAKQSGLDLSGRGYQYGAQSPAMQDLAQRFLAGDMAAGQQLAQMRQQGIRRNELSGMQQFASKYYGPAIMAAVGAIGTGGLGAAFGPLAAAGAGAGWGAFSQGAQTRWKNPAAVGIGAGAGFAGGYGAGAAGQALGMGPVGTAALQGAGGSVARNAASQAYTGQWNPQEILRDAAIGAAVSGGMAGLQPLAHGKVINTPGEPGGAVRVPPTVNPAVLKALDPALRTAASGTLDYYLPGRQTPPNPYAAAQRRAEEDRRRRLALAQRRRR